MDEIPTNNSDGIFKAQMVTTYDSTENANTLISDEEESQEIKMDSNPCVRVFKTQSGFSIDIGVKELQAGFSSEAIILREVNNDGDESIRVAYPENDIVCVDHSANDVRDEFLRTNNSANRSDITIFNHSNDAEDDIIRIDHSANDTVDHLAETNLKSALKQSHSEDTKKKHVTFENDYIEEHYDKQPWALGAVGRVLGLKFAPINIPLDRRFQTFAVLFWMCSFLFMGFGSLLLLIYMFFYTQYWWISLCYLTWFIGDRSICNRGGRRFQWFRKWKLWKHKANFYPVHLIKTCELDPNKNYIMGYHPHGILCSGAFTHFATEGTNFSKIFPNITPYLLTLEGHFLLPFYREFFMSSGAVSASRESMNYLLSGEKKGKALCLVVGGAPEALDCHPGLAALTLNKRKGFCKMAIRHGASLVPMYSFGENEVYDQVANPPGSLMRKFQDWLQKYIGLAPVIFMGRGIFQYSFGIVPFRKPIYTVVGSPIETKKNPNPTVEEIEELHLKYKTSLIELYNQHKQKYSHHPDVDLTIR